MNKVRFLYLLFAILLCSCSTSRSINKTVQTVGPQFRVASYNIRYEAEADEKNGNGWNVRKGPLAGLILKYGFELIGTQEGDDKQLAELKELIPDFDFVGHPYGGKTGTLHNCATFYSKSRFEVLDSGVFWLSETPDEASITWDATDLRICHWTKFKEKVSGKEFFFFNAHFYWKFKIAREQSGPLMVRKIQEIADGAPVICTGDFNSRPETPQLLVMKEMLSDAFDITQTPRSGVEGTAFPGGVFQGEPGGRIDYILVSQHFGVLDYETISDTYNDGHYPSDHLPITSLLYLK